MASIRKRQWTTTKGERRIAWAVDFSDVNGKRERRQFATKREADAFRVEIEGQLRSGTFRHDAARVTLEAAADLFLDHCEGRMRRGERMTRHNFAVYRGHIRNYICPNQARHVVGRRPSRLKAFDDGLGAAKLGQLTASKVTDFRDHLRDAGVSVPTTRKILGTLQLILGFAVSRDLIAANPAKGVKVIGRRDEGARKVVPPSKADVRLLIDAAEPNFRVKLIVAAASGLRAGELHALRWRHLDQVSGEVIVETRVDAYAEEDVTKTAAGMRSVPLGGEVMKALLAWKVRSRFSKSDDLIFPNKRGAYTCHDNMVKRQFYPLFDAVPSKNSVRVEN